jgi:hypothetical protein
MSIKKYKRFELAHNQLETAFMLYITGDDKFSVITLSCAADEIFSQLIKRKGKDNFTDVLLKNESEKISRGQFAKEINKLLYINDLKHMDSGEEGNVSLDLDECALAALSRAMANYNMLEEKDEDLIKVFRYWVQTNLDLKKYNILNNIQDK